jgi:DNA-binding FrmR family transcriptional regulator
MSEAMETKEPNTLKKDRTKLVNRVKRIRGQMDAVERTLAEDRDCTDVLMLLAAVRGGINSLMAEVLEDHIRLHLLEQGRTQLTPELGEELIDLVRAYLK